MEPPAGVMPGPGEIERYLSLLWEPGDVREVRIPKHNVYGHTASGYFDDPAKFATTLSRWDSKANIYVTLNPVNPDLIARASNRVVQRADKTTADADIIQRRWLLIDVDAIRPSGISSTEEELCAAKVVLDAVTAFLAGEGWPPPIVAMSGNGYYALYSMDLPNDAETTVLVQHVLIALASKFDTHGAHVDTTVSNPGRIAGVVGTLKVKGDATKERPHRRSRLESVPDSLSPVPVELLRRVAESNAAQNEASQGGSRGSEPKTLRGILDEIGAEYREQPADQHGVTWLHLRRCPFHEDGRDFECGVGQKLPDGPLAGKCFHPEGQGKGWHEFKVALGIGSGRNGDRSSTDNREDCGVILDVRPLADWLNDQDEEVPVVIGDGGEGAILPVDGKGFIAGPTGIGKTNLLLRLGRCLAEGSPFLGLPIPVPRRVLHLALEGSRRGLRRRLTKVWAGADQESADRFHMALCQINLGEDRDVWRLDEALWRLRTEVLVVDPLRNAHPWDENSSQEMARLTSILDGVIARHRCSIVAAHHDRKRPAFVRRDGGTDRVRGSTALTGWLSFCLSIERDTRTPDTLIGDWTKVRDAEEPLKPLLIDFDRESIEFVASTREPSGKLTDEMVLTAVFQAGDLIRGPELIAGLSQMYTVSERTSRDKIRGLVKEGRLAEFVAPSDRRSGAKSYRLPESQEELL